MERWPLHKAHFWETAPFFRLLVPLVAGILLYTSLGEAKELYAPAAVIIIVTFLLYIVSLFIKIAGIITTVRFALLNILVLCSGWAICYFGDVRNTDSWFGNKLNPSNAYTVRITDAPAEKEKTWKLDVDVLGMTTGVTTGKAFIYIFKDKPIPFHKGDTLLVPGNWEAIKNPGNPFEFDYAHYCALNDLYYQQFLALQDVTLYSKGKTIDVTFLDRGHDWCMAQLDKYITEPKTKGLIQAMLLGDEVNLDPELRQSYSDTGIVHIIAISGGNVAIFFFVISFLLWWLKHKKYAWIKYIAALPLVWIYILMAGSAPSAVRAAIMFTVLAFGIAFQKNNNSLNQLFATAFLLLCAEPMWLFSLGFQLSFAAVLSLILFYGPIYKIAVPTNKILRALWSVICASTAAEILVAPLVVYYFHTFPLLFIVANVAAYIFMSVVLVFGIGIIALSFIPVVAKFLGFITTWLVIMFDKIVLWLQGLNPESFHFLRLSDLELLVLYATIVSVALFAMRKKRAGLFGGLAACCILVCLLCNDEWHALHQQRLVVYNMGHGNYTELITGKKYAILINDTTAQSKKDYTLKPAHTQWAAWRKGVRPPGEAFYIGDQKVLILNEPVYGTTPFPVDYLIINYFSGKTHAPQLQNIFSPKAIVLGNSFNRKQVEKWVGVPLHVVGRDGAMLVSGF